MVFIATIGFRLPAQEKAALAVLADRAQTDISHIMRQLVLTHLAENASAQQEKENVYE